MKILLSPCILDFSQYNSEREKRIHVEELSHIFHFIAECLNNAEILCFHKYTNLLNDMLSINYTSDTAYCNQVAMLFKDLQSNYVAPPHNLPNEEELNVRYTLIKPGCYSSVFNKYIIYCRDEQYDGIIFVGKLNSIIEGERLLDDSELICINNPYTCELELIINRLRNNLPFDDDFFRFKKICEFTNYYFKQIKGLSIPEKKEYFFAYGKITAVRNGYEYDDRLSKLNSRIMKTRRDVYIKYSSAHKPKYYLSVDTEHGGLELFKHRKNNPTHKGEYNFSCIPNQNPKPLTHPLYI